jgi:hypothetical protein
MDYNIPTSAAQNLHKYLVRWRGGSSANDQWVKGGLFAKEIHPYLELFHEKFGTENIVLAPNRAVWILLQQQGGISKFY